MVKAPIIHCFTYPHRNHDNIHVRGYEEEGTTTTPFDMCVRNELDRYHLALDVIERVPGLGSMRDAIQKFTEQRQKHKLYVSQFGEDLPEVRNWRWSLAAPEGETIHQDTGSDNV